jgi:hypothetical protein
MMNAARTLENNLLNDPNADSTVELALNLGEKGSGKEVDNKLQSGQMKSAEKGDRSCKWKDGSVAVETAVAVQ